MTSFYPTGEDTVVCQIPGCQEKRLRHQRAPPYSHMRCCAVTKKPSGSETVDIYVESGTQMDIYVAVNGLVIFRMWLGFAELGITGLLQHG